MKRIARLGEIQQIFYMFIYFAPMLKRFGKFPEGERLKRIQNSPHYRDGQFWNLNFTPQLVGGANLFTISRKFFFGKGKRSKPEKTLPSVKTNLQGLDAQKNCLVWFGHSSYYLQAEGKKILVDPVFNGAASPFSFTAKSFPGSDVYTPEDIPELDYLIITHDHWDHLDYKTVLKLKPKVKQVITGLGTAAHLEYWGYNKNIITEKDWNEKIMLDDGFIIHVTPARHFSGRTLKRNQAIWLSFVLQTPRRKIFLGGDSGYDTHFKNIGDTHGPFDLALLECGQYHAYWPYIHMVPEETIQAGIDLKAKGIMPVHWGKFSLSLHDWDEPIKRATAEAEKKNVPLIHPLIGEEVNLDDLKQSSRWWEKLRGEST